MREFVRWLPVLLPLAAAAAQPAPGASGPYEEPPRLQASHLLPPSLLRSGSYLVRDEVHLEGNNFDFRIESDYGTFEARSLAMLRIRVREFETLAQATEQYRTSDRAFADSLRGRLEVGADSFVDILGSPVRTAGDLAGQLATNVTDTLAAIGRIPTDEKVQRPEQTATPGPALDAYRRSIARQLHLDVYSTNPRVQDFLDLVARARTTGRFSAGIATITIPLEREREVAGGRLDVAVENRISRLDAAELDEHTDGQLAAMGIPAPLRRRFLRDPVYSPRRRAVIAAHLDYLHGVKNRGALIAAALSARNEEEALSFEETARMLALYDEGTARLRGLRSETELPLADTADGTLLVVLPVDLVYWNQQAASVFTHLARYAGTHGFSRHELVLSGTLTERARDELQRLGFTSRERFLEKR